MSSDSSIDVHTPGRKRWPFVLLILLVLLAVGWFAVVRFADVEQYRPIIIQALEEETGLSVELGNLGLTPFPTPRASVSSLVLGEGDFKVSADDITVAVSLGKLLSGVVVVDKVSINALQVQLPATTDEIQERITVVQAYRAGRAGDTGDEEAPSDDMGGDNIEVHAVAIDSLAVSMGESTVLEGYLAARDVLAAVPAVAGEIQLPLLGGDAAIAIDLAWDQAGGDDAIQGTVEAEGIDLQVLTKDPRIPAVQIAMEGQCSGAGPSDLSIDLVGALLYDSGRLAEFTALAWVQEENLIINDFVAQGPFVEIAANTTFTPLVLDLKTARIKGQLLDTLLEGDGSGWGMDVAESGEILIRDTLVGYEEEAMRLAQGIISFQGFSLSNAGQPFIPGIGGTIHIEDDALRIEAIEGQGIHFDGRVEPDWLTGIASVSGTGSLTLDQLDLRPWLPKETVKGVTGTVRLKELSGQVGLDGDLNGLVLVAGLEGVTPELQDAALAATLADGGIQGEVALRNGKVTVKDLAGAGLALSGSLSPQESWDRVALDLTGRLNLASGLAAMALEGQPVEEVRGTLEINTLQGTYATGSTLPEDLKVAGRLRDGRASITHASWPDTLQGCSANFETSGDTVAVQFTGNSSKAGALGVSANLNTATQSVTGNLKLDFSKVAQDYLPSGAPGEVGKGVLAMYDQKAIDFTVQLPTEQAPGMSVELVRRDQPVLEAKAAFAAQGNSTVLNRVSLNAPLALDLAAPLLPEGVDAGGTALVMMEGALSKGTWALDVNLDQAMVGMQPVIRKQVGQATRVEVKGSIDGEGNWTTASGVLTCLDQRIAFSLPEGGIKTEPFNLNLAALTPLLTEGAQARGSIAGTFTSSPLEMDLQFKQAGLNKPPVFQVDAINGRVLYREDNLSIENLTMAGANSDCTINASLKGHRWQAKVEGNKLDLNTILAIYGASQAFEGEEAASAPAAQSAGAPSSPPLEGSGTVSVKEIYLRRGAIRNASTKVSTQGNTILLEDLRGSMGAGTIQGRVAVHTADSGQQNVDLKLNVDQIDLSVLDAMVYDENQEIKGTMSGNAELQFPLGDELFNQINGNSTFQGEKGSFGKMGFATRLLSLLRTTEIIRLRVPKLRDEGLNFDSTSGTLAFNQGVCTIEEFNLVAPSHAFQAEGTLDFPKDQSDVLIKFHILESVTGALGNLPVFGTAVDIFKEQAGLYIRVSGSPWEPTARPEQVRGMVKGVREGVKEIKRIGDLLGL